MTLISACVALTSQFPTAAVCISFLLYLVSKLLELGNIPLRMHHSTGLTTDHV